MKNLTFYGNGNFLRHRHQNSHTLVPELCRQLLEKIFFSLERHKKIHMLFYCISFDEFPEINAEFNAANVIVSLCNAD